MKAKILLVWFLSVLCACSSAPDSLPDGILTQEQMVNVITDAQMLEAAQKAISQPSKERKLMRDTNYIIVFNRYETTPEQFDSSLKVYSLYPKMMKEILEEVAENINNRN